MPETDAVQGAIPLYQVLVEEFNQQYPAQPIDLAQIEAQRSRLESEQAVIQNAEERKAAVEAGLVREFYRHVHRKGIKRSALCFSGGGIRSATFGLGVVEGLARLRLLGKFDFLSTVSGGGYLGSWLSGWVQRSGPAEVERKLSSPPELPLQPEPEPIRHLRAYSRYMSPQFGLLSADTWTLVAVFVRNMVLNWLVLLPLLAVGLMVPRISIRLLRLQQEQRLPVWAVQTVWGLGVLCGIFAVAYLISNRPSLTSGEKPISRFPARLRTQGWFLVLGLAPLILMAIAATLAWYWRSTASEGLDFDVLDLGLSPFLACLAFGVLIHLGGYLLSRLWVHALHLPDIVGVAFTGAVGGSLIYLGATQLGGYFVGERGLEIYSATAAPMLLVLFLLAAILAVGLSSRHTTDGDREWLARAGGWVLIAVLLRSGIAFLVVFGTVVWHMVGVKIATALGGVSGLTTLLLGGSSTSQSNTTQRAQPSMGQKIASLAATLAAPLFALSIAVLLSFATTLLIREVQEAFFPGTHWPDPTKHDPLGLLGIIYNSSFRVLLSVAAGFLLVAWFMGRFVDINRFSLHAAYRDRLIRAYLGASRDHGTRKPNPFTGFDPDDNLGMTEIAGNRPLHIVNTALNLVHGDNLAWQDRKAESFTFSAFHSGNYRLGYRPSDRYGLHGDGAAAVSLGTAMAISGAAASPNMGYHSSPVVTFLLALFNIRLGWWLGNPGPAGEKTWDTPGPAFAPKPLIAEAFGLTNDQHPYIYLSDGGHFENLALYEMVLRRCQLIVLSDGGQDAQFHFEDLGNAVGKIRVDLGVPIEFERLPMHPRSLEDQSYDVSKGEAAFPYCALGRIRYSCVDYLEKPGDLGEQIDGWILYLKPSLNGTEPVDVFHYAKQHPDFPHESTANQLYSESQFESYRALGSHAMRDIGGKGFPAGGGLEELRSRAEKYISSGGRSLPPPEE